MNTNKIKKISVRFPNFIDPRGIEFEGKRLVLKYPEIQNINNRIYSGILSGQSNDGKARKSSFIEGFNCTWRNDEKSPWTTTAQFTFASGEERKIMRIIEKYNGKVISSRGDLQQWGFKETNGSGHTYELENVNEELKV